MATSGAVIGRGIAVFNAATGGGGTLTGANNGLSLSGTTVQLGGTLIQGTVIDIGSNLFAIASTLTDTGIQISGSAVQLFGPGPSGYTGYIQVAGGGVSIYNTNGATQTKEIVIFHAAGTGITVTDTDDNIGLIGTSLFAISGTNQYAQYGNLPAASPVGTVNQRLITFVGTSTYTLYAVPAGKNLLLRIDPAVFANSLGAGVGTYNLLYKDEGGTTRTVLLASISTLVPPSLPSLTIYAQSSSNVQLQIIINIAGPSFDVFGTCYYLGVSN